MAEKNYRTVAVVPEMPRTIDTQQLHVYTPVGSVNNFGVFKPDGQQFVIVNGVLRADASKLIQLANPPAIVTEDGGLVGVDIAFVEDDSTLQRKFQFTFKNIKGATGDKGDAGTDALQSNYTWTAFSQPVVDTVNGTVFSAFNRTPIVGDMFISVYRYLETDLKTVLGVYIVNCEITEVTEATSTCKFKITKFLQIPTNYIKEITGPVTSGLEDTYTIVFSDGTTHDFVVTNGATGAQGPTGATGPTGEQGPKGDDGVSITSVTQTGIDGGTRVTITLSDGQTTSFDVMNGINTNFQVVDVLPTENISISTIYLVPSTTPGEENIYDEYIYVNGNWEHIGSTSVDLSDYVTKTYFNQNVGDATKNYVVAQIAKIHNLYIEMYESGSVPEVGQALTLTNSNFARVPVQGQYFGLLEVVNTKDKYYSICKIASVDTTTCSATVEAVTELDSGTEIEAIKASIATLTTQLNDKADTSALDNKLDKVTAVTSKVQLYAKNPNGSQRMVDLDASPTEYTVVIRQTGGRVTGGNAVADTEFVPKKQMDTAIAAAVEAGVSGCERTDNKVTAITGEGSDVQYPSTKAVVDYVAANAGEAYHIELSGTSGGTLTSDEYNGLLNDVNSYILHTNGPVFKYVRTLAANGSLQYQNVVSNRARYITISSAGAWTYGEVAFESENNKTTTLSSSSTNTQYPSAKATHDADQATLTAAKSYADSILGAEQAWLQKIDTGEGV